MIYGWTHQHMSLVVFLKGTRHMAEKQGTPLTSITGFPPTIMNQLADVWITTAEEFYAAAIQKDGTQGLAQLLHITESEVLDLMDVAAAVLPSDISFAADEIEQHGLGALDEPESQSPSHDEWATTAPLPPQVDLHHRIGTVRDQGLRGTCVAHASIAIREYLLGEENHHTDLSEQFLYWCCKKRDNYPLPGTSPGIAVACLKEIGVCKEHVWPYNPQIFEGNEGQGPPPEGAEASASQYRINQSERFSAKSIYRLQQNVAYGQPIMFIIPVYMYWWTNPVRRTGDIRLPLPFDTILEPHAMCIVGYNDDLSVPGGGYFLVRNSWGTGWASEHALPGYCRIPYNYLEQHATAAYTFWLTT
jgi:C1A family cysteine protease